MTNTLAFLSDLSLGDMWPEGVKKKNKVRHCAFFYYQNDADGDELSRQYRKYSCASFWVFWGSLAWTLVRYFAAHLR